MELDSRVRPDELGARLRTARNSRRITQEAVALALGLSRTTLVAIEAGKRPVSQLELRALAGLYNVSEAELLEVEVATLDLPVQFRSSVIDEEAADEGIVALMLNRLANSVVQLESLVGAATPPFDIPQIVLSRDESLEQQAEDAALALRARLGLGIGPIQDLNAVMESELGLRVFERPLPSKISGAMAYAEGIGGFILLNLKHPLFRRRVTAAHEVAHMVLRIKGLAIHIEDQAFQSRDEKFCDLFGCSLLMPAPAVRKKAAELKQLVGRFTVRELLTMTLYFNVSMEALVRRMVSLNLLPAGTYERLRADGLGLKHQAQVREELGVSSEVSGFTPRSMLLALAAHEKELLTEQQIASMLELDLLTVRAALRHDCGSNRESAIELVP